jgi:predicted nucleic-acid-binding protein
VLVRAIMGDDERQTEIALAELANAEAIVLARRLSSARLVWVLSRGYRIPLTEIAEAIERLLNSANVVVNRPAAEAGLALLNAGGDFADGVIAYEGSWLGGEVFVSFDRKAVRLLDARGEAARLLS